MRIVVMLALMLLILTGCERERRFQGIIGGADTVFVIDRETGEAKFCSFDDYDKPLKCSKEETVPWYRK